jgi:hypothetical protein
MVLATVQNSASVSPLVVRKYGTPGMPLGMAHVPGSFQLIHRSLVGWVLSLTWYKECLSPWKFGCDCELFGPGGPGFGTTIAKSIVWVRSGLV